VHILLFTRAPNSSARAIYGIAPFNLSAALLVIAAGLVPAQWNLPLWIAALLAPLSSVLVRAESGFSLSARHFAERHGLIILIALGESVVGLGVGAGEATVGPTLALTAVLGLALSAGLWWTYFDRDDESGEHAMADVEGARRARLGVEAYWFAHLLMIAGIVGTAAGIEGIVAPLGTPELPATPATRWYLAVGVSVYLLGAWAFRRMLRIGRPDARLVAAVLALATIPLGAASGGLVQLAALVALLVGMLVAEHHFASGGGSVDGD
jgi:low temperature requirement protein LtrA